MQKPARLVTVLFALGCGALVVGACQGAAARRQDGLDGGGEGGGRAGSGASGMGGSATGTAGEDGGHDDVPVGQDGPGADETSTGTDAPAESAPDLGPPTNPLGAWSELIDLRIVAVHSALLPGGKVLMSDGQTTWGSEGRVWNTETHEITMALAPSNVFCGAFEQMPNGRVLVVGGHLKDHYGNTDVNYFDPVAGDWTVLPNMFFPRWYPSVIALGDGRFLTVGGESNCDGCNVDIPEVYDPVANKWSQLDTAVFPFEYYPHLYLLPDGRVLAATTARAPLVSQVLTFGATPSWSGVGGPAVDGGSSVMFRPGKILKTGTATDPDKPARNGAPTAYVIDMTAPGPFAPPDAGTGAGADAGTDADGSSDGVDAAGTMTGPYWRQVASMKHARTFHSMTMLPDGTVLVTGGGTTTAPTDIPHAVLEAELWSPASETWTTLAPMTAPRLYHSEALLLPDARVAVLGSGRFDNLSLPTDQQTAQIFSPPYLGRGPRPRITSAPVKLTYGQTFAVPTPDASRIASVSLIRFGAATHAFNAAQRFVPLSFTASAGTLTVKAPVDSNLAPGGWYMLFLVDTAGVPSVAAETQL